MEATARSIPTPKVLTRHDLLELAAAACETRGREMFPNPRNIEHGPGFLMRLRSTNNTSMAPVVTALQNAGVKVRHTFGSVMDVLGLERYELHDAFCFCHCAQSSGESLAWSLRSLKR